MSVKTLTWQQVTGWRLTQQGLLPRLPRRKWIEAVTRTGGIQAQLMSAAELALAARVQDLSSQDVQTGLWKKRTLVKTWAMRGTLHLLAADELPLYAAARSHYDNRNWVGYFAYYGFSTEQYEALLAAVPQVLGSEPMTREALAAGLTKHTGLPHLHELIVASSWGSPLKPSAFRGDLCFGPSQGQNVTFVNPRKWLGEWKPLDPQQALEEIVRRYLRTYGPATLQEFALWWWGGGAVVKTRQTFEALAGEIEAVEIEGTPAFALRETLDALQTSGAPKAMHLLPLFDAYTLGLGRDCAAVLKPVYKRRVYRPQGWISAVVLVNGVIQGVWEYKTKSAQTVVRVTLFTRLTAAMKRGIEAEAERLGMFLNTHVTVEICTEQ